MEREERARTLAITILQPRPIHSFSTTGSHLFTLSFWLSLSLTHSLTNERTHLRFHLFALFRSYILYNFLSLHTHTHTHPHTHPHTPPYPHPHTPAHVKDTLTHTCTCSRTLFHSYTLVLSTHPITHTHSHTWALTHSHTHPFFQRSVNSPQSVWSTSPVFCVQNFIHFDYKISPFEDLLQDLEGNQNIIPVAGPINKFLGIFKC